MSRLNPRKPLGAPFDLDYFFDRSIPEPNSGCWIWLGAISGRHGYGVVRINRKTRRAHRMVLELSSGFAIPRELDACHTCDLRCCVNPDHLFVGSRADNMRDCANKGRIVTPNAAGEDCPNSKLTDAEVLAIRSSRLSQRKLGAIYGVDKGTIACIQHRKTWRHL